MRELIEARIVEASVKRTAPKVTEVAASEPAKPVRVASTAPVATAKAGAKSETTASAARSDSEPAKADDVIPIPMAAPQPAGSTDPIKPRLVKTLTVRPGTMQVATVAPLSLLSPEPVTLQHAKNRTVEAPDAVRAGARDDKPLPPPPGARPGVLGVLTAKDIASKDDAAKPTAVAFAAPEAAAPVPSKPAAAARETKPRSGWIIQVGAFPEESEALERISNAKTRAAKLLGDADSFTEPVTKGDKTLYRARFAGLKQREAEAACRYLKQNDFVCMAIRN
jgi:D-alanyl-D-alanine carboxypeptidase